MSKTAKRGWGTVFAAAALLCLLGMESADARSSCLRSLRIENGGFTTVTSLRADFERLKAPQAQMRVGEVRPGVSKTWKPTCCQMVRSARIRMCVQGRAKRSSQTLLCAFPRTLADRRLLGDGTIRSVVVSVGVGALASAPSAQATFTLSNGTIAIRAFVRGSVNWCASPPDPDTGEIKPHDSYPFVSIRLKSKPTTKKIMHAEVRGYVGTNNSQNHHVTSPPSPPYDFGDSGTYSTTFGMNRASKLYMCVQWDVDADNELDDNEHYVGVFDPPTQHCLVDVVDFEVLDEGGTEKLYAYVVIHDIYGPDPSPYCGTLTADPDLPATHQGLKVKKIELQPATSCGWPP